MNQDNGGIIGKLNTPTTTVASGVWTLQDQFEAQTSSIWPLAFPQITIANSCRFDDGSTDYLNGAGGAGSTKTKFTFSTWVKRANITPGNDDLIIGKWSSGNDRGHINFSDTPDDALIMFEKVSGSTTTQIKTNRLFRDISAWYNIVFIGDTTQSTSSDRLKLFVNGVQETSFGTATYPSQNYEWQLQALTQDFGIGAFASTNAGASPSSFYLAEVVYLDGIVGSVGDFGAFNPVTNIWEPRGYAGTYGTNGFRLDFANSSALGNDVSGNDNDFTVNNLTSIDQSTDTCSNNFATGNALYNFNSGVTVSEGNLQLYVSGNWRSLISTIGVSTGKWYAEVKFVSSHSGANNAKAGIVALDGTVDEDVAQAHAGGSSTGNNYGYENDATIDSNGSNASYGATFTAGDIIGVAMDLDNNKLYFSKNGTFQNSGVPTSGSTGTGAISINSDTYGICASGYYGTMALNFGSPPYAISSGNADANGFGNFEYAVPSGYFSLCTKNLAEFG